MASSEELTYVLEFGEANAYAHLYAVAPADFVAQYGLSIMPFGSALAFAATGLPAVLFNRVIGLGVIEPITETLIDEIVDYYQQNENEHFGIQISPAVQPAEITRWMDKHRLKLLNHWARLYRDAHLPSTPYTDLQLETIGAADAHLFADVYATAYGLPNDAEPLLTAGIGRPGWHYYMAFDGDMPAATGALFVQNEVGWLGLASTLPNYRRHGAQSALIARRVRDGIALGCQSFVTETTENTPENPNQSYLNLIKLGFKLVYMRPSYES